MNVSKLPALPIELGGAEGNVNFFRQVCLDLLEVIDTPFSLSVALQIEYNLSVTSEVDISKYQDPVSLQRDLQALAIVKKNPWIFPIKSSDVLHMKALAKFEEAERMNTETNNRLRSSRAKAPYAIYFDSARRFCEKILGNLSLGDFSLSPGANTSLAGKDAHVVGKLKLPPHCTSLAYDSVIKYVLTDVPHYALACGLLERNRTQVWLDTSKVEIHDGNKFTSVPKDWRANRPICIEPHGNMIAQKAYGSRIRASLKKFGYDLRTLQDTHGELARTSSITDSFATIDLASASDTVSLSLVKEILPYEWYDALFKLRCRKTICPLPFKMVGDFTLINEKFSSMGNGYTFELETLIFLCLALAVREVHGSKSDKVSVYGDDIIVDKSLAVPLIKVLQFAGLSVNTDKTFISGPFKESCGHDYYNGNRVRPIYLKELPSDEILQLVSFANRIREIANCSGFGQFCDSRFRSVWDSVVQRLPRKYRYYGPKYLGDAVITSTRHEGRRCRTTTGGITRIRTYGRKYQRRVKLVGKSDLMLCCALYGVDSHGVIARDTSFTVKATNIVVQWDDDEGIEWI